MPFTPFTRDSHKRVLSFASFSKEKHLKERCPAKKTSRRFLKICTKNQRICTKNSRVLLAVM